MRKKKGLLIVISGPSGVGKSTVRRNLIDNNKDYWYSISMTTRNPRIKEETGNLEENGKDYFFVSKEEFKANIKNNNFFEYAEVYKDTFYGTPKNIVLEKLNDGYNVILEIDVQGALLIKKQYPEALLIFINPPSIKELDRRLHTRKSDGDEKIIERLKKAEYEISFIDKYDYVIESQSKEHDYIETLKIIEQEKNSR